MINQIYDRPPTWPDSTPTSAVRRFPITVRLGPGETAGSLLGRTALENGYRRLQDVCTDQQISFRELANGREKEVRQVARLAGADPNPLLFHTPCLHDHGWFVLGRERIKFSAFQRMGGQICPVCLMEDGTVDGRIGPYQRGIWQVGHLRICHRHGVVLERKRLDCTTREAHDIIPHLRSWAPTRPVFVGDADRSLETYLLARIMDGRGAEWTDRFEFHAVAVFCEALGALLQFGANARPHRLSPLELVESGGVGFGIFQGGPDSITGCLNSLRAVSGVNRADYGKLYAPLMICLRERRRDPDFDQIRHLIREYVLENFYIPAGTSLLGRVCEVSRVTTVGIASKEANVPISLLNRQLKSVGVLIEKTSGNTISDRAALIPRRIMDNAVSEVRKLSSFAVMRAAIGADRYTMERLCADGLVKLHFPAGDGGMPVFHDDEVGRFVERLLAVTDCSIAVGPDHVPMAEAAARCHCTIAILLTRAMAGEFRLTSPSEAPFRLMDFFVDLSSVKRLLAAVPAEMITAASAAKLLGVACGTIHALAEGDFLPAILADFRLANRQVRLVRHADLEAFANKHIVLRALSGTRKATYEETQRYIADCSIFPLPLASDTRKIFRRTDIERIAYRPGASVWCGSCSLTRLGYKACFPPRIE